MVLLRETREKAGLNQKELEALSGVPQQTISSIESRARDNPGIDTVYRLARALGKTMDEIYRPEEEDGADNE